MPPQQAKNILDFETGPKAEFIRNNPGCNAKIESSSDEDSSSEDDSSDDDEPKKRKVLSPEQQFIKKNKPKNPVSAYIIFCHRISRRNDNIIIDPYAVCSVTL